ncbi:VWA domain-containing protein (plasmid) [Haloplanus ruber]|uniref:VWA domain-containing protein n=1 Tax=Haloplanus ruber TaxID=869892 RepID=A0ABD6D2G9_9EURY|nr:VWA domain-containing protein [Haloplanus ruber]
MSHQARTAPGHDSDLTPPEAAQVRTSRDRATSIKQYIEGLLPSDLAAEVDVVITENVATAAVMPATEDALLDGDETDFDRQQAQNLINRVDGDYLVLVTGREADTDSICLSDQLTADAAHQFGLAFHETLHVLKTSFGAVQSLVETEVEAQYHEFVHELINIVEDGAIENEAQTGDDFTERAGNRLTLIRQMHSQTVADLPSEAREFTFGEAVMKALHDRIIFDTGVTDALLDESDPRVTFASASGREAFQEVHEEVEALRDDVLAMRSDHSDRLYEDDRKASIQRAKRAIAFWQDVLKPLYEDGESQQQGGQQQGDQQEGSQQQAGQQGQSQSQQSQQGQSPPDSSPDTPEQANESGSAPESGETPDSPTDTPDQQSDTAEGEDTFDCPECEDSFDSDHGRSVHYGKQHGDTDELDEQLDDEDRSSETADGDAGDIDPEELSLDTDSIDSPLQGVQSHPSLADEPDPDDVDTQPQPAPEHSPSSTDDTAEQNDTDDSGADGGPSEADSIPSEAGDDDRSDGNTDTPTEDSGDHEGESEGGPESTPDSHGLGDESAAQDAGDQPADSADQPTSGQDGQPDSEAADSADQPADSADSPTGDQDGQSDSEADGSAGDSDVATTDSSANTTDLASHTDQSSADDTGQQATFGDFGGSDDDAQSSASGMDSADETAATSDDATRTDDSQGETAAESDGSPDTAETSSADTDPAGGTENAETNSTQDDDSPESAPTNTDTGPSTPMGADSAGDQSTDPDAGEQPDDDPITTADDTDSQRDSTPDTEPTDDAPTESPAGPAHDDADLSPEDFASDRNRAKRTADRSTVDEQGLAEDLQTLEDALGEEQETTPDGTQQGNGAGPGSVDELTILPDSASNEQSDSWGSVQRAADTVADTLAKELRLDQQTATRGGLSSGTTVNTKTAYRLGHNDPRTFSESLPGDEKEYFVVIVLDRSGSMSRDYGASTGKIDIATSAVARFAVACENLDIDVAVIDFYDDEARYVKPPSVETEYAQEAILATDTGGRTPLADALSLARTVADADRKESLIISITDDKPDDVDAVEAQTKASYSPICSLTIATDCHPGDPPEQAEKLERAYNQTTTVFEPSKLDSRIDELASLLGAH